MLEVDQDLIMRLHQGSIDKGCRDEGSLRDSIRDDGCIPSICEWAPSGDPFVRAAYFFHRISTRHPFVEGNKRTSFMTAALIIYSETEYMIENDVYENNRFVRLVASGSVDEEGIEEWLREHVIRSRL